MGGLYTIVASARLLPPSQDHFGLGEMVTCGTWHSQVANEGPTATTVSAPPTHQSSVVGAPDTPSRERTFTPRPRKPRICREWNYSQCSYPGCQFIHACLTCFSDPLAGDGNHKVMHCPKNAKLQQGPVVRPLMGTPNQYPH